MSFYKEVPGRKTTLESTLKFDPTPTEGSTNPVTSEGVKSAIDGAVGYAAENLQEQIDDIAEKASSGYTPKGPALVATLNGLSGQENGWLYTMTDAGTLTDGSLAVVSGDTVAWDATNEVWYKAMDYAPRQYGTNEVHNLPTSITAFRTGDYIAVDGTDTAKMSKDDLLKETAENAYSKNGIAKIEKALDLDNVFTFDGGQTGGHYNWNLQWEAGASWKVSKKFSCPFETVMILNKLNTQYADLVGFDDEDNCVYYNSNILNNGTGDIVVKNMYAAKPTKFAVQVNTNVDVFKYIHVYDVESWMQYVFDKMLSDATISDQWRYVENSEFVLGSYDFNLNYNSSSTSDMYAIFNVVAGAKIKVRSGYNQWVANIFFERADGTLFGKRNAVDGAEQVIFIPTGAVKMYVWCPSSSIESISVWENKSPLLTRWYGKRIAFFGTSIPAGYGAGLTSQNLNSYPKVLGKYLTATVENMAVGSSCVCYRFENLVDENNNPYGFGPDFERASRCITNNLTQMQWVIDHYNYFTINAPSVMTEELEERIKSYSYEKRVLPFLNGEKEPVDLILIEHGHNDMDTPNFTTDTTCSGGMFTYAGCMKFLLDEIWKLNSRQEVMIVSHYENWQHTGNKDIHLAQSNVAKYFELPFIDISDKCGFSENPVDTYGKWRMLGESVGIWESDEELHSFDNSVELFIPDGTHPHTDKTGYADRRIAKEILRLLV